MKTKPTYFIMVSSTYKELLDHRRAVVEALNGQQMLPLAMEFDAAIAGQDLIGASLAKVDKAHAYVGLISYRYGQMPECGKRNRRRLSLTELEYDHAVKRKIPICMFIMHDDHLVPRSAVKIKEEHGAAQKLESFLSRVKKGCIYAEFKSVDDLKAKAIQSLVTLRELLDERAGDHTVLNDISVYLDANKTRLARGSRVLIEAFVALAAKAKASRVSNEELRSELENREGKAVNADGLRQRLKRLNDFLAGDNATFELSGSRGHVVAQPTGAADAKGDTDRVAGALAEFSGEKTRIDT